MALQEESAAKEREKAVSKPSIPRAISEQERHKFALEHVRRTQSEPIQSAEGLEVQIPFPHVGQAVESSTNSRRPTSPKKALSFLRRRSGPNARSLTPVAEKVVPTIEPELTKDNDEDCNRTLNERVGTILDHASSENVTSGEGKRAQPQEPKKDSSMSMEEIIKLLKTHSSSTPRLAKGFLAYILSEFATTSKHVDRDALQKGYQRGISEHTATLAVSDDVKDTSSSSKRPARVEEETTLSVAPECRNPLQCGWNCGAPCMEDEVYDKDENIEAIITSVESSLAQLNSGDEEPVMSDLSSSTYSSFGASESFSTSFDSEDKEGDGRTVSSLAFSDIEGWIDFIANGGSSSEDSEETENSAFRLIPSFDVTEWMLRE
jgi:hypothetical protein